MAENPYTFTSHVGVAPKQSKWLRSFVTVIAVICGIGLLVALLLPARRSLGPAARRNYCANNLKQIALALRNYEATYNSFPPAYTVDADGKPLHSWRTLILPFMEKQRLYEKIDLAKPWDDPANMAAVTGEQTPYWCPASFAPPPQTTYLAVVGPKSCLRPTEPRRLSDFKAGLSATLMVIEAPQDRAVPWMSPNDADEQLLLGIGPSSKLSHGGGTHAAFADGSVRFLEADLPAAERRAMISVDGRDEKQP